MYYFVLGGDPNSIPPLRLSPQGVVRQKKGKKYGATWMRVQMKMPMN